MTSKRYIERLSGNKIRVFTQSQDYNKAEALEHIANLEALMQQTDSQRATRALMFGGSIEEAEQEQQRAAQLREDWADLVDIWDMDQEVETVTTLARGWMKPSEMTLGPAVVLSASSEVAGSEAALALDGAGGTFWLTDPAAEGPHEIVFDLGYQKRIDGIRFRVGQAVSNTQALAGLDIYASNHIQGLGKENNRVASQIDLEADGTLVEPYVELDLEPKNGRFLALVIGATGANSNQAKISDIELRFRARAVD